MLKIRKITLMIMIRNDFLSKTILKEEIMKNLIKPEMINQIRVRRRLTIYMRQRKGARSFNRIMLIMPEKEKARKAPATMQRSSSPSIYSSYF